MEDCFQNFVVIMFVCRASALHAKNPSVKNSLPA